MARSTTMAHLRVACSEGAVQVSVLGTCARGIPRCVPARAVAHLDEGHHTGRQVRRGGCQASGEGRVRGTLLGQLWVGPVVTVCMLSGDFTQRERRGGLLGVAVPIGCGGPVLIIRDADTLTWLWKPTGLLYALRSIALLSVELLRQLGLLSLLLLLHLQVLVRLQVVRRPPL